ncbi:hypothetical protein [Amycolatopsis sp. GM8]|uniref:hypothetical protein n=1 Tax=Amycolatopsis sp. GM8 TaxID=2896530 RepID=UPI001F1ADDE8|nr:hypothetical protein [Amycolatopsis sp. GM8]
MEPQSYTTYLPPWPADGKRPKTRLGLIAAVVVGALAVVGGVVTVVSLTSGDHASSSAAPSRTV